MHKQKADKFVRFVFFFFFASFILLSVFFTASNKLENETHAGQQNKIRKEKNNIKEKMRIE